MTQQHFFKQTIYSPAHPCSPTLPFRWQCFDLAHNQTTKLPPLPFPRLSDPRLIHQPHLTPTASPSSSLNHITPTTSLQPHHEKVVAISIGDSITLMDPIVGEGAGYMYSEQSLKPRVFCAASTDRIENFHAAVFEIVVPFEFRNNQEYRTIENDLNVILQKEERLDKELTAGRFWAVRCLLDCFSRFSFWRCPYFFTGVPEPVSFCPEEHLHISVIEMMPPCSLSAS